MLSSSSSSPFKSHCLVHEGERLNLFCSDCNQIVCGHCLLLGDHTGHKPVNLKEAQLSINLEIASKLPFIQKRTSSLSVLDGLVKGRAADISRVSRDLVHEVKTHFANLRACLDERERAIEAQIQGIGSRKQARIGVIVAEVETSLADAQGLLRVCTASEEDTRSPFGGGSHPAPHDHIPRLLHALARIRELEAGGGSLVACDEGVSFDVRLDVGASERGIEGIALVDSPGHLPEPPLVAPTPPAKKTQPQLPQLQPQLHGGHARPSPGELLSRGTQPAAAASVLGWNAREMGSGFRLGDGGLSCLALSSYLQTAVWGSSERGASEGIHHWQFEVTAMAVHTWIGLVPRDRDVYSFLGRGQEAMAYSSAGTIVQATKITTKPGAVRFTTGDLVGLILHCDAATLTVTINGIAVHTFHGVPNPAWPAISMPFPGNVTVKSYEKII